MERRAGEEERRGAERRGEKRREEDETERRSFENGERFVGDILELEVPGSGVGQG